MSLTGALRWLVACVSLCAALGRASGCGPAPANVQEAQRRLNELAQSAKRELEGKQFSEAIRDFQEAACLAPREAQIFNGLGSSQAATGDFLAARKSFSTADRLQPDNPLSLVMLVRVNTALSDVDSLKANLLEASARFANNAGLHSTLAQFLLQNKLADLALAESLRAYKAQGAGAQSSFDLAVLENTAGAYEDSIRHAAAVEAQTDLPSGMRASAAGVAGLSYESIGEPEPAIRFLNKAIELDPTRENSYLSLAFLLEKRGKYADACDVLRRARVQLPESTALLLPLGSDLVLAEKYQEGIEVLQDLLKRSPDTFEAYLRMADAFRKMSEPAREVHVLEELAGRNANYPGIHVLLARALLTLDPPEHAKALTELELTEKSAPPNADTFYLRGKIYLATNQETRAAEALSRAIELQPMDPAPYYQLGRLYQKLGKAELAKDTFARLQFLKNNGAQ
jgi:tetratricopeptide (TPR) repeat protein